jgi:hypothetical protein
MTQNTYRHDIDELRDLLIAALDGDARAAGLAPEISVRDAEILGEALAAWE